MDAQKGRSGAIASAASQLKLKLSSKNVRHLIIELECLKTSKIEDAV